MASFFDIETRQLNVSTDNYITCAGTVRAPHGAAIRRRVVAYLDNDPTRILAQTESTLPTATFSMQLPGFDWTEYTIVVKGERGENDEVVANCGVSVSGVPGQYIAPSISNLQFVVGNDAVTSPYVDVIFQPLEVDAEVITDYVLYGQVEAPGLQVDAYVINATQMNAGISLIPMRVDAVVENITVISADIKLPLLAVEAEAVTVCDISGKVEFRRFHVDAEMGLTATVRLPKLAVSSEVVNTSVINADVKFNKISTFSDVIAETSISAAISFPKIKVNSLATTDGENLCGW